MGGEKKRLCWPSFFRQIAEEETGGGQREEKKRKGEEEEEEIGANIDCGEVAAASGCEQYV